MKLGTDQWRKVWNWAQKVQNTEPQRLDGDITYYRCDGGVCFDIPVWLDLYREDSLTTVSVLLTDNKRVVFMWTPYRQLYQDPKLVHIFYDTPIDRTEVVGSSIIQLQFHWEGYQPDWDAYPYVIVVFELNLFDKHSQVWVGFLEDEPNHKMIGKLLWETIKSLDGGDTDENPN